MEDSRQSKRTKLPCMKLCDFLDITLSGQLCNPIDEFRQEVSFTKHQEQLKNNVQKYLLVPQGQGRPKENCHMQVVLGREITKFLNNIGQDDIKPTCDYIKLSYNYFMDIDQKYLNAGLCWRIIFYGFYHATLRASFAQFIFIMERQFQLDDLTMTMLNDSWSRIRPGKVLLLGIDELKPVTNECLFDIMCALSCGMIHWTSGLIPIFDGTNLTQLFDVMRRCSYPCDVISLDPCSCANVSICIHPLFHQVSSSSSSSSSDSDSDLGKNAI
jgi:hypothetical protein